MQSLVPDYSGRTDVINNTATSDINKNINSLTYNSVQEDGQGLISGNLSQMNYSLQNTSN